MAPAHFLTGCGFVAAWASLGQTRTLVRHNRIVVWRKHCALFFFDTSFSPCSQSLAPLQLAKKRFFPKGYINSASTISLRAPCVLLGGGVLKTQNWSLFKFSPATYSGLSFIIYLLLCFWVAPLVIASLAKKFSHSLTARLARSLWTGTASPSVPILANLDFRPLRNLRTHATWGTLAFWIPQNCFGCTSGRK